MVRALIETGAGINLANNNGASPLYAASQQGHLEVVRELLRGGASIDQAMKNGFTPLCIASQNGHLQVVRELLKGGADHTLARVDEIRERRRPSGLRDSG